jgi:hypothetical protein
VERNGQTSGASRREIAKSYLNVIASEAKQSMAQQETKLDCFASLAMTDLGIINAPDVCNWESVAHPACHHPRKRMIQYSRGSRG